jgi:hypothetical protein
MIVRPECSAKFFRRPRVAGSGCRAEARVGRKAAAAKKTATALTVDPDSLESRVHPCPHRARGRMRATRVSANNTIARYGG